MNSLLDEIPTLEVSTTIVEEITPEVFIPWEVYQAIYQISPDYLQARAIESSLCDRYLDLRRRLELQYALLLIDPDSKLYNSRLKAEVQTDLPILANSATQWDDIPSRLPSSESVRDRDQKALQKLLREPQFLITLKQLGKLKALLDRKALVLTSDDSAAHKFPTDLTYAQTSIKIDGKIANCYATEILELDSQEQKMIIDLHNKGIFAGEKQWHQFFGFILKIFNIFVKYCFAT